MQLSERPEAVLALMAAGWTEHRREDVSDVVRELRGLGVTVDSWTREVLASLVGLVVPLPASGVAQPCFINGDPLTIDPLRVARRKAYELQALEELLQVKFCPLGQWLCFSNVYFSTEGLAVAALPGVVWHLGDTFEDAIEFMLLADRPLIRLVSEDGFDD